MAGIFAPGALPMTIIEIIAHLDRIEADAAALAAHLESHARTVSDPTERSSLNRLQRITHDLVVCLANTPRPTGIARTQLAKAYINLQSEKRRE